MAVRTTKSEMKRAIAAVEAALRKGYQPPTGGHKGQRTKGALRIAAEQLDVFESTVRRHIEQAEREYGLTVNWALYKEPPKPKATEPEAKAPVEEPDADPIIVRKLRDQLARSERLRADGEREAITNAAIREGLFRLSAEPLRPPSFPTPKSGDGKHREAIVLFLSDVHMGETIDLAQMGGRNQYNETIARKRLERYFQSAVKLGTKHWSGPSPLVVYLVLGGDLISGEIHEELAKTNDLLSIPAVRAMSEAVVAGINCLLQGFPDLQVRVISVPGNHGRTTRKPEAKGFALDSYDTLVAWCVESWFAAKGERRVIFSAPASGDALVNICGWKVLFTHGDRIGSRGGQGFVGPAATAARGMKRLVQDYAAEGEIIDIIVMGHLHTALELEEGFVNASLAGPSEYSRSGRFRSKPATQLMFTVHPEHGVARRWQIQVGDPSEGSIYRGRQSA